MLVISPDALWRRHERYLLMQGVEPRRTPEWDARQRNSNLTLLAMGAGFLIVGIIMGAAQQSSRHAQPSPLSINGRNVSMSDYKQCGPNPPVTCPPHILGKYTH